MSSNPNIYSSETSSQSFFKNDSDAGKDTLQQQQDEDWEISAVWGNKNAATMTTNPTEKLIRYSGITMICIFILAGLILWRTIPKTKIPQDHEDNDDHSYCSRCSSGDPETEDEEIQSLTKHEYRQEQSNNNNNKSSTPSSDEEKGNWKKRCEMDDDTDANIAVDSPTTSTTTTTTSCEKWKSRILVIAAAMLTGSNFILVKKLNGSMPVGIHSTLRFALGALFSSPWLFLKPMTNKQGGKQAALECLLRGGESGLWDGVGYLAQALGLRTVPVAVSSFIVAADIMLLPILDCITGIHVLCRQWWGAVLAMMGVVVLTIFGADGSGPSSAPSSSSSPATIDLLLTLLQPVGFGVAFWRLGHGMERFPGQAARLTAAQMQATFALSLAWGLWEIDISSLQYFPWSDWFSDPKLMFCLVFAGLGTDLLANFLVNLSRDNLSSLESFLLYSTEQIWAVLLASIFLGESIGLGAIGGAMLIMVGCVLVSKDIL